MHGALALGVPEAEDSKPTAPISSLPPQPEDSKPMEPVSSLPQQPEQSAFDDCVRDRENLGTANSANAKGTDD